MANNLTLTAAAAFATGKFGQGLSAGKGIVTLVPALPFTVETWIITTATVLQVAVGSCATGGTNVFQFWLGSTAAGFGAANSGGGSAPSNDVISTIKVNDGLPHHVAMVYTASGGALYVDGVAQGTTGSVANAYGGSVGVGGFPGTAGGSDYLFTGVVDEVRISTGARYTASFTPQTTAFATDASTTALWHLDGNGLDSATAAAASLTLSPSSLAAGSANQVISITGTGLTAATFTLTGGRGAILSAQSVASATSATITVSPGLLGYGALTVSGPSSQTGALTLVAPVLGAFNVGFIGDSITAGTNGNPVAATTAYLQAAGYTVTATNRGISGYTTADWLPSGSTFQAALTAFQAAGTTLVQIMLGTNDVRTPLSLTAVQHNANMRLIVAALVAAGIKVIIHKSPFTIPNVGSGAAVWPNDSAAFYRDAWSLNSQLINGTTVFGGDTTAFAVSALSPSTFLNADGIHPADATANNQLGQWWAVALLQRFGSQIARWTH